MLLLVLRLLMPPSVGVARATARGELLESSLSIELGEPLEVQVADDYAAIVRAVRDAGAELVWAPSAACAEIEDETRAIWKTVREGRSEYRSALVARTEARLALERLSGKRAAWVDPLSIGGYLLVRQHLLDRGIDPSTTFVDEQFLGTHPAALEAVLADRADVAAVSVPGPDAEHVMQALSLHAGRAGAARLLALAVTEPAPNDALVLTRALDETRAKALAARVFAKGSAHGRTQRGKLASLCLAMECEGFDVALPGEYARLRGLTPRAPRRTMRP
jgi:ABC-type phosphate/phosphonate transport system substrate-binding protein